MQRLIRLFAVLLFIAFGADSAIAHDATPSSSDSLLAGQGFPELSLTADDTGLIEPPSSVKAGRYLITYQNDGSNDASIDVVQVPSGSTYADIEQIYIEASTSESFPDAVYDAEITGGVNALAGSAAQVILDLQPGSYLFAYSPDADDSSTPIPVEIKVTGTFPAVEDPASDVEVGMFDMGFDMPDQIDAGSQVWKLTNTGDQPHFIDIATYPSDFTVDQALDALTALFGGGTPEAATPDPNALDPSQFEDVASSDLLSSGMTNWVQFDLKPGHYIALCFIPDRETGVPHAFMGMAKTFTVV